MLYSKTYVTNWPHCCWWHNPWCQPQFKLSQVNDWLLKSQ